MFALILWLLFIKLTVSLAITPLIHPIDENFLNIPIIFSWIEIN